MGCYGIGVERILSAAVEAHHDEQGILWPASIAPHDVYLVGLGLQRDEAVAADAEALYVELQDAGLDVMFDDRDDSPGVKFNDADLIGVPIRLTVSARNHKEAVVELKRRDRAESEQVPRGEVVARVGALRRSTAIEAGRGAVLPFDGRTASCRNVGAVPTFFVDSTRPWSGMAVPRRVVLGSA
jgi:prolyl-tRNA synthetase